MPNKTRKFKPLLAVRENACKERIDTTHSASDSDRQKLTARDRRELLMYERYRRSA